MLELMSYDVFDNLPVRYSYTVCGLNIGQQYNNT
jgi:hypothetical protein